MVKGREQSRGNNNPKYFREHNRKWLSKDQHFNQQILYTRGIPLREHMYSYFYPLGF